MLLFVIFSCLSVAAHDSLNRFWHKVLSHEAALNSAVNHWYSQTKIVDSCVLIVPLCAFPHSASPSPPPQHPSLFHPSYCSDHPLSISQAFEKQLKDEKDSYERRIRELQLRLDDARREGEVEATTIKTDLRLAREDVYRLQQDLEDAEEKLKDGEAMLRFRYRGAVNLRLGWEMLRSLREIHYVD